MATIKLTPLVLLNIADHHTRNKNQNPDQPQRIIGALLGKMVDRQIKISQSFEIICKLDPKTEKIVSIDIDQVTNEGNHNFLDAKLDVVTVNLAGNHFKDLEFIGWYSTSKNSKFYENDMEFHEKMSVFKKNKVKEESEVKEDALYLCLDPNPQNKIDLPVLIYEAKHEKGKETYFQTLDFEIEAEKSETISIESAQVSYDQHGSQSQFSENMNTTLQAVNRFNEKIDFILKQFENPRLTKNLLLMRELNEILNGFPIQFHDNFNDKMLEQYSDSTIISYFSAITASHRIVNDVLNLKQGISHKNFRGRHDFM